MIRYLTVDEVEKLHERAIVKDGGSLGIRDAGLLDSAVANPQRAFGGEDLFPGLFDKAASLGHSIVANHAFVDGNKRAGFTAMTTFLRLNGWILSVDVGEGLAFFLALAAKEKAREELAEWLKANCAEMVP